VDSRSNKLIEFNVVTKENKSLNLNNFDKVKNRGLPDNYNLVDGWWLDRQKEIISFLNSARFA
jgi:hypothetical protein